MISNIDRPLNKLTSSYNPILVLGGGKIHCLCFDILIGNFFLFWIESLDIFHDQGSIKQGLFSKLMQSYYYKNTFFTIFSCGTWLNLPTPHFIRLGFIIYLPEFLRWREWEWESRQVRPGTLKTMVLIPDGNSAIGAHVHLYYLICLRHLLRKDLFSYMRAQHVLSYHLI